ncbi:MAG: L-threonylcarbamoyladenylate synthase [Bowdeniella nasicola]|nr:L-threonylcarbamoyladenylate synthase [Bowdeniella nasicola]
MIYDCQDADVREAALDAALYSLKRGGVVVLPTDTVYGIGADAFDPHAVARLLTTKGRGRQMPPPVLIAESAVMDALATEISEPARALAEAFWPGPLTLILPAQPQLTWDLGETRGTVALRVPDDELSRDLLRRTGPLAVSSANRSGLPPAVSAMEAEEYFGFAVPVYLDGGSRTTLEPSTIVDACVAPLTVVRSGAVPLERLREVVPDIEDGPAAP